MCELNTNVRIIEGKASCFCSMPFLFSCLWSVCPFQPTWDATHIQGVFSESRQRGGRSDLVVVRSVNMQLHHIIPFDH